MPRVRRRFIAAAVAAAGLAVGAGGPIQAGAWPSDPAQQPPEPRAAHARAPELPYDALSLDLAIRNAHVDAAGADIAGTVTTSALHVEQVRVGDRWRTEVRSAPHSYAYDSLTGSRTGETPSLRFVDEGDGTPIRAFDASDREIQFPAIRERFQVMEVGSRLSGEEHRGRQVAGGAQPPAPLQPLVEVLFSPHSAREARASALRLRYGDARGAVAGRERFVLSGPDGVNEVLVDPAIALPVEVNRTRNGKLVSRKVITYEPQDGGVVPRRMVLERVRDDEPERRHVTAFELRNVRFERRGRTK